MFTDTFALQLTYISGEHLARVEPKRTKHMNRVNQLQTYNYFSSMPLPFFRGGRDYTYIPNDPRYTPRSMPDFWPRYQ